MLGEGKEKMHMTRVVDVKGGKELKKMNTSDSVVLVGDAEDAKL